MKFHKSELRCMSGLNLNFKISDDSRLLDAHLKQDVFSRVKQALRRGKPQKSSSALSARDSRSTLSLSMAEATGISPWILLSRV